MYNVDIIIKQKDFMDYLAAIEQLEKIQELQQGFGWNASNDGNDF